MSDNFRGITFARQHVAPADDAIVRRAILPDGILSGCKITYSGYTLTVASGYMIACGRMFQLPAAQNFAVTDATSGYARLVFTLDMTKTATKEVFDQISAVVEYASAEDGFSDLEQTDINLSGVMYQIAVCVVSLGSGGITGIVSSLDLSRADGAGLNFSVVGGTTQPTGPKENMIWVNTSQKIASWILSASEPETAEEGMVWISIGTSSPAGFNALKKNGIQVCPISAKQYVDGAWVDVTAKSYQGGEWVDWIVYLYEPGNTHHEITGGWNNWFSSGGSFTIGSTSLNFNYSQSDGGTGTALATKNKIDLTGFAELSMKVSNLSTSNNGTLVFGITRQTYASNHDLSNGFVSALWGVSEGSNSLDVSSLTGEYYIVLLVKASYTAGKTHTAKGSVTEVKLS